MLPLVSARSVSTAKHWFMPRRSATNHGDYSQVAGQDPEVHPFLAAIDSQDREHRTTDDSLSSSSSEEKASLDPSWARVRSGETSTIRRRPLKPILAAILAVAIIAAVIAVVVTTLHHSPDRHQHANNNNNNPEYPPPPYFPTTPTHNHHHGDATATTKEQLQGQDLQNSYMMMHPCGHTAAEARDRGCLFDIISFSWFPPACYDAQLSQDFDDITTWEWFLDPNATQPVSHESAMTGEYSGLYVNWEYHIRHCTAMWLKMHRAVLGGGKAAIDSYIGELTHTRHCGDMLLTRDPPLDALNTIILLKFPHCGIA